MKTLQQLPIIFLLVLSINSIITSNIQASDNTKLVQIATIDYPPLVGIQGGIMTDIVTEAFKAKGIAIEYKIYPMARIVWSVTEGTDLAIVGSRDWFHNKDKLNNLYPVSIYFPNLHFFSLKEKFPNGINYEKLNDLKKFKIGYVRGGSLIPIFNKANLEPELVTTLDQNANKLYARRIDLFAATELGGWAVIQKNYPDKLNNFTASSKPIHHINGDIIFANHQKDLMNTFQQGFDIIIKNGVYLKILKQYYGNRKIPARQLELIK